MGRTWVPHLKDLHKSIARVPHSPYKPTQPQLVFYLNPATNLALKLALKGFAVTFVVFEYVHQMLSGAHNKEAAEFDLFSEAHKSGLMREFQPHVDDFVATRIRSDPNTTYFIVADAFLSWQAAAAVKYNLVYVSFWTQPSLIFSLACHSELPIKDNVEEDTDYIPGIQSVNTRDFMTFFLKQSDVHTTTFKIVTQAFNTAKKADFVLHNTVQELESSTLSALNKYQPNYAIGPTNFYIDLVRVPTKKSLWAESNCTQWLESKPPGSVLYISYGSLFPASKHVIEEIAHGVILSQVNFIWVMGDREKGSRKPIFPAGFEDEFKDKGLIVPWCNQINVLSSPSVGAFLTHCGWNSVVESIWYGIPMLCDPLIYDQPINRKLVVDDWKIGLNLCDGKSVERNDVAEKIKILMSGNTSKDFYHMIINIRDKLRTAVEPDGSSDRNLNEFINKLKEKLTTESAGEQPL